MANANCLQPTRFGGGGGVVAEIFRGLQGVVAEFFFPLTAITDPKFVLIELVFCPNNLDSLPELMSASCPDWGGGQLPP